MAVSVFFASATVVLNHFAEESQIQTYNLVIENHTKTF